MSDTPRSLLERLRDEPDEPSWRRLHELYSPLIRHWIVGQGVAEADANDLLQDVFVVVVRELPAYQHNGHRGAFRRWLHLIATNKLRGFWRDRPGPTSADAQKRLADLEDPGSELHQLWDREHNEFVVRRMLEMLRPEFTLSTWEAFRKQVIEGRKAADVAAELNMAVNTALAAKSRVLRRFRREIAGLVDEAL